MGSITVLLISVVILFMAGVVVGLIGDVVILSKHWMVIEIGCDAYIEHTGDPGWINVSNPLTYEHAILSKQIHEKWREDQGERLITYHVIDLNKETGTEFVKRFKKTEVKNEIGGE